MNAVVSEWCRATVYIENKWSDNFVKPFGILIAVRSGFKDFSRSTRNGGPHRFCSVAHLETFCGKKIRC